MVRYIHTKWSLNVQNPNWKAKISLELAQCEKSLVGSNRVVHVWEPHDAAEKKACLMSPHRDLKSLLGWLYSKFSHSEVTIIIITRGFFFHYVRRLFIFLSLMNVLVYIDIYKHLTKKVLIKFCAEKKTSSDCCLYELFLKTCLDFLQNMHLESKYYILFVYIWNSCTNWKK